METENKAHNLWNDYLVIGLVVAVLLVILGFQKDVFYQSIPVIVFLFITGIKENMKVLKEFGRRQWVLTAFSVIYVALFLFVSKDVESAKYIVTVFLLIFAGNCMVRRNDGDVAVPYRKLWVFMLVLVLYGMSKNIRESMPGAFTDITLELAAVIGFLTITMLYLEEKKLKVFGAVISVVYVLLLFRANALRVSNILYVKGIFPIFIGAGPKWIIFGRGYLSLNTEYEQWAENSFSAILFDYGLLALTLYISALGYAIFLVVKAEDKLLKKQAIFVCVMIILSFMYSAVYWGNMMFLVFTGIGAMLGRAGYVREDVGGKG